LLCEAQEPHPQPPPRKRGGDYDVLHVILIILTNLGDSIVVYQYCLHTVKEFKLNCSDPQVHHPYYFAIADYNNTLVCYWDLSYKFSQVSIWDLQTGEYKRDFELAHANEFGLGKNGKVYVVNFQDFVWSLDIETQEIIGNRACSNNWIFPIADRLVIGKVLLTMIINFR
jgi:hypothetical protein